MLKRRTIEAGRLIPRGGIDRRDDLEWEAYLQAHDYAEGLGLLAHDQELHEHLNAHLAIFEKKYGV